MASNFKIIRQRKNGTLHLKLSGDFDGTSALELIEALKEKIDAKGKICVDTDGLKSLSPFGLVVFYNNFDFPAQEFKKIVFTGDHTNRLYPLKTR